MAQIPIEIPAPKKAAAFIISAPSIAIFILLKVYGLFCY